MDCIHGVLPSKLTDDLFHSDVEKYKEALYKVFKRDFVDGDVAFDGKKVDIIHEKFYEGKERSFWHIISEGEEDTSRTPISWRAEVLPLIKPLLQDQNKDCEHFLLWKKYHDKTKKDRYYIWCTAVDIMIVLEDRKNYYKLITAYPVLDYKKKRYIADYRENCIKTKTPTTGVDEISAPPTQG